MRIYLGMIGAALITFSGCTLNVDDKTETIPLVRSAAGVPRLTIDDGLIAPGMRLSDVNEKSVTVEGSSADRFVASVTANSLEARGDEVDFSAIGMAIDDAGNFSLSYSGPGWQRLTFSSLAVQAPSRMPVSITGSLGNIAVSRMDSTVTVDQHAGSVTIDSCSHINVTVDAGDVTASVWEGGAIDAKSGDVDVRLLMSDSLHAAFSGLSIDLNSGDSHIHIPSLLKGMLDLETKSGRVKVDGVLSAGSGSSTVLVRTDSGDITVEYVD